MDDLLTIGWFARLAGLSVGALRHYDELDLLRPAQTDPVTSYRLYRQRVLHILGQLDSEDPTAMTAPTIPAEIDATTRRRLAADLFNHTWTLLETTDRTREQDDEMLHAAHASRFHWGEVADAPPASLARGEWQCSRVYAVLGRAEPALWHARRCLAINEANGAGDWDIAAAYEAMARACLTAGDLAESAAWKARATAALADIADADDREVIEGDLATLP